MWNDAYAQAANPAAPAGQAANPTMSLLLNALQFLPLFIILYFLLIRPQQKQAKEHQKLLTSLKRGEEVVTQGGLIGSVFQVEDRTVTLDIGGGTKVRVLKANVIGAWVEKPAAAPAKPEKK